MTSTTDDQPARPKLRNRVWVWRNGVCLALHPAERGEDERYHLDDPRTVSQSQDGQP